MCRQNVTRTDQKPLDLNLQKVIMYLRHCYIPMIMLLHMHRS